MPNEAIWNRQLDISFVRLSAFNYTYAKMASKFCAVKFSDDLFCDSFSRSFCRCCCCRRWASAKNKTPYVTKGIATSLWQICLELQINIIWHTDTKSDTCRKSIPNYTVQKIKTNERGRVTNENVQNKSKTLFIRCWSFQFALTSVCLNCEKLSHRRKREREKKCSIIN